MADSPIEQRLRREASAVRAAGPDSVDMYDSGVAPLSEPKGYQLHVSGEGKGQYEKEAPAQSAVLSKGMGGSKMPTVTERAVPRAAAAPQRALSAEELMALANAMHGRIAAETAAIPNQPTAVQSSLERDPAPPLWLSHYMSK